MFIYTRVKLMASNKISEVKYFYSVYEFEEILGIDRLNENLSKRDDTKRNFNDN